MLLFPKLLLSGLDPKHAIPAILMPMAWAPSGAELCHVTCCWRSRCPTPTLSWLSLLLCFQVSYPSCAFYN